MTENFETRFAAARRRYIASRFGQLNPMQREAVLTTEGPLLLLAGAGSGKTTVLIQRIANLITFGCGSDSPEVPFAATEEDLAFLEGLEQEVPAEDQSRAEPAVCSAPGSSLEHHCHNLYQQGGQRAENPSGGGCGPQSL